jgi:hypothetical protein
MAKFDQSQNVECLPSFPWLPSVQNPSQPGTSHLDSQKMPMIPAFSPFSQVLTSTSHQNVDHSSIPSHICERGVLDVKGTLPCHPNSSKKPVNPRPPFAKRTSLMGNIIVAGLGSLTFTFRHRTLGAINRQASKSSTTRP